MLPPTRLVGHLVAIAALIDELRLLRDDGLHHRAALGAVDGLDHRVLDRVTFFPFGRFRDRLIDDVAFLALGRFLDILHAVIAFIADLGFANGLHHGHPLFPFGRFQNRLGNRVVPLMHGGLPDGPVTRLMTLFVLRFVLEAIGGRLTLLVLRLIDQPVLAALAAHAPGGRINILGCGRGRPNQAAAQQHGNANSVHVGPPRSSFASTAMRRDVMSP